MPRFETLPATIKTLWTLLDLQRRFDPAPALREPRLVIRPGYLVREQPVHRAGPFLLDRDEVLDALLEVPRVGVHAAEHDLVAEHEPLVDQIDRLARAGA